MDALGLDASSARRWLSDDRPRRVARARRRADASAKRDAPRCVYTVARVVERGSVTRASSSRRDETRRDETSGGPTVGKLTTVRDARGRRGRRRERAMINTRVTTRCAYDNDHSSSSVAESFNIFLYSSGSSQSASIDALSEQNSCSRRSSRFLSSNFCEHFSPPKPRLK